MNVTSTLWEILEGYERFNAWELEEQKRELPRLTVEESLTQFFELCDLARTLAPDAERIFLEQDKAHWIALREKLQCAAKVMGDAKKQHFSQCWLDGLSPHAIFGLEYLTVKGERSWNWRAISSS